MTGVQTCALPISSGLALYWIISNVLTIATQYLYTGWGGLIPTKAVRPPAEAYGRRRAPRK